MGKNDGLNELESNRIRKGTGAGSYVQNLMQAESPHPAFLDLNKARPSISGHYQIRIPPTRTQIGRGSFGSPDDSICEACKEELFEPQNRRFGYPFIHCPDCGPRPPVHHSKHDNHRNRSLDPPPMCPDCSKEYDDPADRRFRMPINHCPVCGPRLTLYTYDQREIDSPDPVSKTAQLIKQGNIVAIKGQGGFYLVVDAENDNAVRSLRTRKHREEQPFALMAMDLNHVREFASPDPDEAVLLSSTQRPIVLLTKKDPHTISQDVAPVNRHFGVLLPYAPLHYLILNHGFTALVMTSGNQSDAPIVVRDQDAFDQLADIADYVLTHNQDIDGRREDSIFKKAAGSARVIRRSRALAPVPIRLNRDVPPILACGGENKNTVCIASGKEAFLSPHIGSLTHPKTFKSFLQMIEQMKKILGLEPDWIVCDLNDEYHSTRFAEEQHGIRKIGVQHHHAHILSAMVENNINGPVIGLSFDGGGHGNDGTIWGGEVLLVEEHSFFRAAHLKALQMPGGEAAIREPWRMTISYLRDAFGEPYKDLEIPLLKELGVTGGEPIHDIISDQSDSSKTSSLGRLFDAVAVLVGLRPRVTFEDQAAMELEMLATQKTKSVYPYEWIEKDAMVILPGPIIRGVVGDIMSHLDPGLISAKFHQTLVQVFVDICVHLRRRHGLDRVVLSGGVFQNARLLSGLMFELGRERFRVFANKQIPANNGGISLGQVAAAAAIIDPVSAPTT